MHVRCCWREKRTPEPIEFPPEWNVEYGNVKTGDIESGQLVIEVKHSVSDLVSTFVGQRRKRFEAQGDRMARSYDWRFIAIRPTASEAERGIPQSRLPGWRCLKYLREWCERYRVVPLFGIGDEDIHLLIRIYGENTNAAT